MASRSRVRRSILRLPASPNCYCTTLYVLSGATSLWKPREIITLRLKHSGWRSTGQLWATVWVHLLSSKRSKRQEWSDVNGSPAASAPWIDKWRLGQRRAEWTDHRLVEPLLWFRVMSFRPDDLWLGWDTDGWREGGERERGREGEGARACVCESYIIGVMVLGSQVDNLV